MPPSPAEALQGTAQAVYDVLQEALTCDLTVVPRSGLTFMRLELDASKRLQAVCGQVAPWASWRAARLRIEAELELRPVRPLMGKDLS